MTDAIDNQEEFALQAMFGRAIPPVADRGFSKAVVGRVRLKIWKRRLVLLSTAAIGLVIALPAIPQLLLTFSNGLATLAAHAGESDTLRQFQVLLTMLPLRETAQAASEEIANVSARIGTISWYLQNKMIVLAGLMALITLAATRLLER